MIWLREMISKRRFAKEKATMRNGILKIYHKKADRQTVKEWA